jgi:hypothetical protein
VFLFFLQKNEANVFVFVFVFACLGGAPAKVQVLPFLYDEQLALVHYLRSRKDLLHYHDLRARWLVVCPPPPVPVHRLIHLLLLIAHTERFLVRLIVHRLLRLAAS